MTKSANTRDWYDDTREDWDPIHGSAAALAVLVALGLIGAITFATLIWWAQP